MDNRGDCIAREVCKEEDFSDLDKNWSSLIRLNDVESHERTSASRVGRKFSSVLSLFPNFLCS